MSAVVHGSIYPVSVFEAQKDERDCKIGAKSVAPYPINNENQLFWQLPLDDW